MTPLKYILLSALLVSSLDLGAQEAVVRRGSNQPRTSNRKSPTQTLSERVRTQSLDLTQSTADATWARTIYRRLDLSKERNAVLYYPPRATERQHNLFVQLFRLIASGSLKAYEYLDGEEIFEPEYEVKLIELLDRFRIPYTLAEGDRSRPIVALADLPSSDVRAYYVRETWYFDQATSTYDTRIDAICPVLYDIGDYGEIPLPLFWIPYEALRGHINTHLVMLSSHNNVARATLDDFFRLRLYDGEIVKTHNLRGLSIAQSVTSPDSLIAEQARIERELQAFGQGLYLPDSIMRRSTDKASTRSKASRIPSSNSRDKRIRSATSPTKESRSGASSQAPRSATRSVREP